ncbi:hypothetical protein H6G36_00855 [Anabaena minutissima FACHB-250]|nr:hypothetical protein [Anabaena minutissima FACHB-250]
MQFLNRLTGSKLKEITDESIILGQWQIITESEIIYLNSFELVPHSREYILPDAANRFSFRSGNGNINGNIQLAIWQIPSDILSESLRFFAEELNKLTSNSASWEDWIKISPLVPEIENKIETFSLEETAEKHFGHIEEVCRRPRSYLKMETEKLPVSRAQRISPHAIEVLAAHTEDWERRNFRSIVPKRVLCMVREDLWDIYENQVTVSLIDKLLEYTNRRIQQVTILKKQLEEAEYLSGTTNDIYWRNRRRIYQLWGNQFDAGTTAKKAEETLRKLQKLQHKLRTLLGTDLYKAILRRASIGRTLKRTNILVNDQHYRYVDVLWREWSINQSEKVKTARQVFEENQQLFRGFESFCFLLLAIALTGSGSDNDKGFGFEILTNVVPKPGCDVLQFRGTLGELSLTWEADGSFLFQSEGIDSLRFVPLLATLSATNNHEFIASALQTLFSSQQNNNQTYTCVLYPGTEEEIQKLPDYLQQQINLITHKSSFKILPVSPLDIVSVERVGRMIQWWLSGQRYQSYPPTLLIKIPDNLVTKIGWLEKGNTTNQFRVLRQPLPQEVQNFRTHLEQKITAAKAQGSKSRGEVSELEKLQYLPHHCQELIQPLQVCPVCYSMGSLTAQLDSQCFRGECHECGSSWGTRGCGSCGQRYPFIQLPGIENQSHSNSSLDRTFGRDVLAIPCWSQHGQTAFTCTHCSKCV